MQNTEFRSLAFRKHSVVTSTNLSVKLRVYVMCYRMKVNFKTPKNDLLDCLGRYHSELNFEVIFFFLCWLNYLFFQLEYKQAPKRFQYSGNFHLYLCNWKTRCIATDCCDEEWPICTEPINFWIEFRTLYNTDEVWSRFC